MARKIITGIDVGTSRIKVVVAEQKGDTNLNILGLSQKNSEGIRRGYVVDSEEVSSNIKSTIRALEKSNSIPQIKQASIAIGGIGLSSLRSKGSIVISRADGEITDYDIKRVLNQCEANLTNVSNKQIIHEIPLLFKIDNSIVQGRPVGMKGSKLEAETLYITVLNHHLNDLIKSIESADISVDDIVASPLAASAVVLNTHQKEVGCVLANIGANTISIVVFEENRPISLEVFSIGSTHITNDIALGLQIPLDEAEKIKLEFNAGSSHPKKQLANIIEARLNDVFELIESHLKKINRNRLLPAGIILTGGGSNLFSLEEIARSSLKLPAKVASPLSLQNIGINISGMYKDQVINDPRWSVAVGLCVINLKENFMEGSDLKQFKGGIKLALKKVFRIFLP
ncbi:MAG: cell division protein FtsA [Patescibacteria group bacterium]